jgi:hypothetical protein
MKPRINLPFYLIFLIISANYLPARDDWKQYSAADSLAISEMTVEEMQNYRADFFPFSLAEKGRQSAPAWRGMPPGFLDYQFVGLSLYNPLWGYWDNQHLPLEIIRQQDLNFSVFNLDFRPAKIMTRIKPVSRIAYSQDFQFGLSYLDVNLLSFYRPQSFFSLGGNNFLRDGSAGEQSKSQVNTYRGQIHHQFSTKFSVDVRYWQLRHKFTLSPFPVIVDPRKIKRIGQILWFTLNYQPDSTQSIIIIPYGYKWGDRYHNTGYFEQRKTELYSLGIKGEYQKTTGFVKLGVMTDLLRHEITKAFVFSKKDLWSGKVLGNMEFVGNTWSLQFRGGYWFMPDVENQPEINLYWKMQLPLKIRSNFSIAQVPQILPLSSLFWQGYAVSPLVDPRMPLRRGISWEVGLPSLLGINLTVEPYYYIFKNSWAYDAQNLRFIQRGVENSGILAKAGVGWRLLELQDEVSYNSNYQKSFIPEYKNVLKLNLPFSMFQGALRLENYLIYQFIGKWQKLEYDPLTNQYFQTSNEISNFHLLDVKILAHIKTATIFMVWENLLSEDYAWVDSYSEFYRLFRFGLYWTLFD